MPRFKPIKVNYVALYFRDWVPALYRMSTIERGIYDSLIFHIYESGGRLENKTSLLAQISGLPEAEFVPYWEKLKHKFVQTGDYISHKRCTEELKKTFVLCEAGRKGAEKRWKTGKIEENKTTQSTMGGYKGANSHPMLRNETNTKPNNNKTNTSKTINPIFNKVMNNIKPTISDSSLQNFSPSCSSRQGDVLQLYSSLSQFFIIRNNGDRSCLDNICKWACQLVASGQKEMLFYKDILRLAEEAKLNAKSSRWEYFMDSLKRDFGYVPPSKS